MFKCTECGVIHKIKPEYCDCGNNVFTKIISENISAKQTSMDKIAFADRYPFIEKFKKSLDPLSLIIFGICMILSVVPWIFILENSPQNGNIKHVQTEIQKKEIPDINKIWDDTPIKPLTPPALIETVTEEKIIPQTKQIIQKPVQEPKKIQPKIQETKKTSTPVEKTQPVKPASKPQNDVIKRIEQNINKPITEKPAVNQQPKLVEQPVYKPTGPELAELNHYKNTLRMILLSKLNVQSIIGEGDCDIEFSIDPSGKLLNRKFSKQSANKSLNDAIYYMLMSVPLYKSPPKAYKGETIKLHFYINNGYYEISFK